MPPAVPASITAWPASQSWHQWPASQRLLYAILAGANDSCPPPPPRRLASTLAHVRPREDTASLRRSRPFPHPHSLRDTLEAHRASHPFRRNDPRLHAHSLRDTLEAHRAANEAAPIRNTKSNDKFRQQVVIRPSIHYMNPPDETQPASPMYFKGRPQKRVRLARRQARSEGQVRDLKGLWALKPDIFEENMHPWLQYMDEASTSTIDVATRLNAEIRAFEEFMSPTAAEKEVVSSVYRQALDTIHIRPQQARLMGSQDTGLARILSDIDVNIGGASRYRPRELGERGPSPGRPEARKEHQKILEKAMEHLRMHPKRFSAILIKAKVPIITAYHRPTGLSLEIQSTEDANANSEYLKNYMREFPTLRPVFFVLKHFLHMRGLGKGSDEGLGSYALANMLVASLKFSGGRYSHLDAGSHLLEFLKFYSAIDFSENGISVEPLELFQKRRPGVQRYKHVPNEQYSLCRNLIDAQDPKHPYLMCLQDPANPSNDLGRIARTIKHIQATMADAASKLNVKMDAFKTMSHEDRAGISMLGPLLAANYALLIRQRARLLAPTLMLHDRAFEESIVRKVRKVLVG